MLASSNLRRNFKRRRNGRSPSVFNIWSRDNDTTSTLSSNSGFAQRSLLVLPSTTTFSCNGNDNCNYQKYGCNLRERTPSSSSSSTFPPNVAGVIRTAFDFTKAKGGSSGGGSNDIDDDDEISTDTTSASSLPLKAFLHLLLLQFLLTLPRIIRLLSIIPKVTCISHYWSKLFSHQILHQTTDTPSASKCRCNGMSGESWSSESNNDSSLPSYTRPPLATSSLTNTNSHHHKREHTDSDSQQKLAAAVAYDRRLLMSSFIKKRVRCQISSVRSDFICIIVCILCILTRGVTPVITSNEVYPMDAATSLVGDRNDPEISVPVEGVVGKRVDMPCDISPNRRDDSVYMVLWFRGDESIPIYSLDVRGKHFSQAKHWSAEIPFGKRGHFQTTSEPARLIVEPVRLDDQGIYRCRVDFRNSPSRETRLNLTVTVPPDEPQIYEERNGLNVRGEVGPYREGSSIELKCIVRNGIPSPTVFWYLNDELLDSSFHVESENEVINHISVPNVQRSQHRAILACRAHNTLLIQPVVKTVVIELNLRPLSVSILHRHSQLATDTQYEITCESWGSHPPPKMTWFLGNRELTGVTTEESRSSNTSVSRLLFIPTPDVDGQLLICRSENTLLEGSASEDSWPLRVVYSPILNLRLGSSLNPKAIKEGDDVYFECLIRANPSTHKLSWYHNGLLLTHNRSAGVILSNQSLALQKVSRPSAGNYSCRAQNAQGEGVSNRVQLEIMYAPACRNDLSSTEERAVIIAASRSEDVNITCEMDALPNSLRFHWTHTNTVGETVEIESEIYSTQGSKSFLYYNLRSEEDFGTLLCWAQNSIGAAERPCVYQLVPADSPQPVENCSIINRTSTSVEIICEPGFDGGLPQSFFLEAFQTAPPERRGLHFNISSSTPSFSLSGLDADGTFHFKIYSVNRKGNSSPSIMDGIALHYPAMQSAKVRDLEKTTIAIIIGAVSAVVLSVLSLIIFVVHRLRNPIAAVEVEKSYSREFRPSRRSSTNDELYHHHIHNNSKNKPTDVSNMDSIPYNAADEEGDPDLIPSTRNVKTAMGLGKTYSRLSNGEINQRSAYGGVEKFPLRSMDHHQQPNPDMPLTMEQHSMLSNYATFARTKPNGLGLKQRQPPPPPRPIVSSTSGSFHGKPSSVVVNIDTRLIGQQLASNQLPESCV